MLCHSLESAVWRKIPSTRHFWCVKPTGDYEADCQTGTRLALDYLRHRATEDQNTHGSLLQHIVGDMPRSLTGVEIGFLTLVDFAATAGKGRAEQIAAYWDKCRIQRAAKKRAA